MFNKKIDIEKIAKITIKYSKIRDVNSPNIAYNGESVGIDFFIPNDFNDNKPYILKPQERILISSGIKFDIPTGYALIFFNKSGISVKFGLDVLACVVDPGYQNEVHIHVVNTSKDDIELKSGMKIVQGIIFKLPQIKLLQVDDSELYMHKSNRHLGGFGSSGI